MNLTNNKGIRAVARTILGPFPPIKHFVRVILYWLNSRNKEQVITPFNRNDMCPHVNNITGQIPKIYFDVTLTSINNEMRGIQRVVSNILTEIKRTYPSPTASYQIIPVKATKNGQIIYAEAENIGPISIMPGDLFLSAEVNRKFDFVALCELCKKGLRVYFVIHDLLDVRENNLGERDRLSNIVVRAARRSHTNWLNAVLSISDGVVCVSQATANELTKWLDKHAHIRTKQLPIGVFHLGADYSSSAFSLSALAIEHNVPVNQIISTPSFLMVGALDPHKAHVEAIEAFELLWGSGIEANLVIVGREGLLQPSLGNRIYKHPEYNHRLFWLSTVTDEVLSFLYNKCCALLAASYAEGFGLPLIEAAHHGLPIIARDIPVFHEVAGDHAWYFKNKDANSMAESIKQWLTLFPDNLIPDPSGLPYFSWASSASQLIDIIINNNWYIYWAPTNVHSI